MRPRVVVAPDKFKGSLTAAEVVEHLGRGLRGAADVVGVPVADGGEGTLAAALAAGFEQVPVTACGPTGAPVDTCYARRGDEAVIEMADVCGLGRLGGGRMEPLRATSTGLGEVMRAALEDGCTSLVVGVGGSACTDGGAGMVRALGARVLDAHGDEVGDGGAALARAARLDLSGLHPGLAGAGLVLACDVENPLTGPNGAAAVYGPQKGASRHDVAALDEGLRQWARVVASATGADRSADAGAGAAGGVGFGALAVLGATSRPGADLVLALAGFADLLPGADLVVTGEGSLDAQSLNGKAPAGVAAAAARAGVPVVAVCGTSTLSPRDRRALGLRAVYALRDLEPDLHRCMRDAPTLLERTGERLCLEQLPGLAVEGSIL